MTFRRAQSTRLKMPRPQPRRGAFALEPVSALTRLWERIEDLAERALEPNPFFLPEFLEPAMQALGSKRLRLASFSDRGELRFFAPVVISGRGVLGARRLAVWTHPYAPLGAPLIHREGASQAADSLIEHMRASGRTLLTIPDVPLDGPAADALCAAADRRGFWTEAGSERRPILRPGELGGIEGFEQMTTQKRRSELDRQLRKLCDAGAVSVMMARSASDVEAAFNMFLALEECGGQRRRGTALTRRRSVLEFARRAVMQLAQKGHASVDVMRVGERPVAALVRFDQGGLSIPWKIAYDESFAASSPGRQLICDETRRWLGDPAIERVDPVCEEGNPLFAGLWHDNDRYGTLLISSRSLGLRAHLKAGRINLWGAARRQWKALTRPRKRRPKSASARQA